MKWSNILLANEKKIKAEMQKAHWDALFNKHMRFVVNIDDDGDVWILEDIAGGNSFSARVFNGEAAEVVSYCFQYWECNPPMEQRHIRKRLMTSSTRL